MFINYNQELKSFIKKALTFCLPILIIFAFFDFLVVYSGELMPAQKVIHHQFTSPEPVLFGRKWAGHQVAEYKYLGILKKRPDIIALGSSRILQIRQAMFNDYYSFYNAGLLADHFQDLIDFIKLLPPDYQPEIIILGIDSWQFSQQRAISNYLSQRIPAPSRMSNWAAHLYVTRKLFLEVLKNPSLIKTILSKKDILNHQPAIGFHALDGNSFRPDGSRYYGQYLREIKDNPGYIDRELPPIIERLKTGYNPFQFNQTFSQEKLALLKEFLELCQQKNILVIGLAPAYSTESYQELTSSPHHQQFFSDFQNQTPQLFKEFNFPYFDFSGLSLLELNNSYMFDGFHVTETGMSKILLKIFNSPELTNSIPQVKLIASYLEQKLSDSQTTPIEVNW